MLIGFTDNQIRAASTFDIKNHVAFAEKELPLQLGVLTASLAEKLKRYHRISPFVGQATIISPVDDQRPLSFERFTDIHSRTSAQLHIEWRQRIERAVDLWFIAVRSPNVQGNRAAAKPAGRQKTRQPPLRLTDLLGDCSVAVH